VYCNAAGIHRDSHCGGCRAKDCLVGHLPQVARTKGSYPERPVVLPPSQRHASPARPGLSGAAAGPVHHTRHRRCPFALPTPQLNAGHRQGPGRGGR
jgi:hypothetical protein